MALATPSVPRTCCFEASEISCTSSADCRTTLEIASKRFAGLVGQLGADFHFLGSFFHHDDGFIGFSLNGLDQRGNVFGRGAGVFRQLANFVSNHGESAAGFAGTRSFDGGVKRQQVGLLGNVIDDVDDLVKSPANGHRAT